MRVRNRLALLASAFLATPAGAFGQQIEGNWGVDVVIGAQSYASSSALNTGAFVAAAALYQVSKRFAVGPALQFTRGKSDGAFFTAALDFGADSARVFQVGQQLNTLHYTLDGRFDIMPENNLNPYVMGGVGGYTMYLESNANSAFGRLSELMFQVGGGVRWAITEGTGVSFDVRDVVYTNYDRDQLNPIRPEHRNCSVPGDASSCRFPEAEMLDVPAKEETIHNFRFSIGLTFIPGIS